MQFDLTSPGFRILDLTEKRRQVAEELADLERKYKRLDKFKDREFEMIKSECRSECKSEAEAARKAIVTARWEQYIEGWTEAKYEVDMKRAELDDLDLAFKTWQALNANSRAEMQMTR